MKKTALKNIIKEILKEEKGYSRYAPGGTTSGLTKANLDKILLRIAKGEDLEGDSEERGNKVLDKANPENVARIIRGEEPIYNEEVDRMQELAGIQSEIKVNNPNIQYQSISDIGGDEDFEDDFPNEDYQSIIKKLNEKGFTVLEWGYDNGGFDVEDKDGNSYFAGVMDGGSINITDDSGTKRLEEF